MKSIANLLAALAALSSLAFAVADSRAPAPLKVVATLPDLADITGEIGGERVEITTLCKGRENIHAVTARPSHMVAMNKADLFVQIGLSLESSFVPGLLEAARNPRIQPGAPGFVNCSVGWEAIEVPSSLSRQGGDLHPQGNPHMNLDPRGGRQIADRVLAGLVGVDPSSKAAFEERHAKYVAKLDAAERRWSEAARAWAGAKLVTYHQEFNYLARARGLTIVGTVESKPGIPATPNHLAELIATMKREGCKVILTAPWSTGAEVERIAEAAGARVVELPNMCGGAPGAETWIGMMDIVHRKLGEAFAAAPPIR